MDSSYKLFNKLIRKFFRIFQYKRTILEKNQLRIIYISLVQLIDYL